VIVLGTGVERGRLVKLGHWWGGRWIADGDVRGEVLLAGEALHLPPEAVFEVLLHEATHGLNASRGVKDSSRGGRYHNARFKATAEELGLVAEPMRPYGWASTSIGPAVREHYEPEIDRIRDAMRIARRLGNDRALGTDLQAGEDEQSANGNTSAERERRQAALCACGRRMRMAPSVLAQGPVLCGLCGDEFAVGRTVVRNRELGVLPQGETDRGRTALPNDPLREPGSGGLQFDSASVGDPVATVAAAPDRRTLTPQQQEGLAALVELGATGDGALLLTRVGAWYAARKAGVDRPLLGETDAQIETANLAARSMLKLDGTLHGPTAVVRGRELSVGELVRIGTSDARVVDVDGAELPSSGGLRHNRAHRSRSRRTHDRLPSRRSADHRDHLTSRGFTGVRVRRASGRGERVPLELRTVSARAQPEQGVQEIELIP
jgi:hypothetical protein